MNHDNRFLMGLKGTGYVLLTKELRTNFLMRQPQELAGIIGKSEKTIKTRTVEMQEKGLIRRENGKRNGRWEVLVKL